MADISGTMKWVIVCVVCTVVSCAALAVWWMESRRLQATGDEPHYLIIAASVLRDGDIDLWNNYEEDTRTAEIYGPMEPHVVPPGS